MPSRTSSCGGLPEWLFERTSRRQWLRAAGAGAGAAAAALAFPGIHAHAFDEPGPRAVPPKSGGPRKKVAAVVTTYFPRSHAYHIVGRFLWGYFWNGTHHQPGFEVVSLYTDQVPENDVSRPLAQRFGFKICPNVAEALTLGTGALAVDAVLLVGEHGNYPMNAKRQRQYPRFELYEQVVGVFEKSKRSVPVFNDKHLSYDFAKAKKMVADAKRLGFPLMAGSSLPVTWRRPELELPLGTKLADALVAGYGHVEGYGIHALEAMQCMVERREGGETGVAAVTCRGGDAVWQAAEQGIWSWNLLEHALGRSETLNVGDIRVNAPDPYMIHVEYRDGTKATVLMLRDHVADFTFAAHLEGKRDPTSCLFVLPSPPGANYFSSLCHNIEKLFETGRPPYPIERTLLTSGILDLAMSSLAEGGKRRETPELDIVYKAPADSGFARGEYTFPAPEESEKRTQPASSKRSS